MHRLAEQAPETEAPMTEAQREFLREHRLGRVSTIDEDGFPHITPVRLDLDDDGVRFEADGGSRKMRNIRRNPRIGIVVDGERKRGVLLQGLAEIVLDASGKDQALVRLAPARVVSWRLDKA